MDSLQREIQDLRVAYQQLQDVIEQSGGLAIPPQHMQVRVVGKYAPDFFKSGRDILDDIERVLAPHGKRLASFPAILDFGCGCGRIVAALPARLQPGQRLFGSDIDPEAIDWCQAKYSSVAEFALSPHTPRTLYRDGQFDFVYGISIFTHLPESMQFDWLRELERITAPGGYLVLSTHGKSHLPRLPSGLRAQVEDRGFGYVNFGTTEGLPEFYLTTYHSERYIRERWSEFFDVLSVDEIAIANKQDAVVCRRRWDDE